MNNFRFVLNKGGVGQLLKSAEMQAVLASHASTIKSRCGEGYETKEFIGFDRAHYIVYPDSADAIQDNYNHNTLLKARGGGI